MARKNPMVSRRWLINYVLILLIIVFTYIGNKYNVQTGYQADDGIISLKAADIDSVTIRTADSGMKLIKSAGRWIFDDPLNWYANNIAIERIIDIVNARTDSKLPSNEIDLSTLGLQFPKAILGLNDQQIAFGATNNIGERRYLLVNDNVYLLKDRYLPFITQGIHGLLDRRLLPRALSVESLKLPDQTISKLPDSGWGSDNAALSAAQAARIIDNWQALEASRIQQYRQQITPKQKITAIIDQHNEIEFYVISISPQLIIARADLGIEYHFKEKHYYGLLAAEKHESTAD